jgi:hypothetical protein
MKLTKSQLKEIIKEEIQSLNENSMFKTYMNKPSDSTSENMIRMVLNRKIDGNTAWYRLETDGWFRRYWNPGKGYGIMLRDIRIAKGPSKKSPFDDVYIKFTCKYLPNQFDDLRDDVPQNWESAQGFIVMNQQTFNLFHAEIGIDFLQKFIKNNVKNYIP